MVSILPPKVSPFQAIGRAMSEFGRNAPELLEKRYERGQIQQGLKDVANISPEDYQKNPLDALTKLLSSFAGTRQGAQYAEAVLPEFTKYMQSSTQVNPKTSSALEDIDQMIQQRPKVGLPGFMEKSGQPPQVSARREGATQEQPQPLQPAYEDVEQALYKGMGEKFFPFIKPAEKAPSGESFRPQRPPLPPMPLGVSDENKMRVILSRQGVKDKALQDQYIERAKQIQKESYAAEKEGFGNLQDYRQARQAEDQRFWSEVKPNVEATFPGMDSEMENLWKGISRTVEDVGSDEARLRETNQRFNQYVYNPLSSFADTGPALPIFSILNDQRVKDSVEDSRSHIQDHLNSIRSNNQMPDELKSEVTNFLRKKYRTQMAEKDFGTAQSAYAVSNLSDHSKSILDHIPKYPFLTIHPKGPMIFPKEKQEKYVTFLSSALEKLEPEDSLILARERAIENGYPEEIFNRALNQALKGKLRLSDFQRQERPELSIPQRMDLNSIMRGKRSIWDLFKAKK